jgi:hypothetical protein
VYGGGEYGVKGGEGASDRYSPAAKYLYWSICKKSRHLGFGCPYKYLVHGSSQTYEFLFSLGRVASVKYKLLDTGQI